MSRNLAFECRMCGQCCLGQGGIVASAPEQKRLAEHLGCSVQEFRDQYTEQAGAKTVLQCSPDGYCRFFSENGCSVHVAKPDICRAWPFFRGNLVDKTSWELAQDYCPGINPDVPHEEFVRQGLEYLRTNHLDKEGRPDEANALYIRDLS